MTPASTGVRAAAERRARNAKASSTTPYPTSPTIAPNISGKNRASSSVGSTEPGRGSSRKRASGSNGRASARIAHQQRRLRVTRRRRQILDEDGRAQARDDLASQPRKLATRNPALGDERAPRRAELAHRVQALQLVRRRPLQDPQAVSMGPHQRLALALDGLDGSGKLREPALHRSDGRAQRGAPEGLGQRGVANLHAPEQVADRRLVGVRIDDEAADRTVLDVRPDQLETGPELLRELVAERLEDRFVAGVEHQRRRYPTAAGAAPRRRGPRARARAGSIAAAAPGTPAAAQPRRGALARAGRVPRPAARGAPARRIGAQRRAARRSGPVPNNDSTWVASRRSCSRRAERACSSPSSATASPARAFASSTRPSLCSSSTSRSTSRRRPRMRTLVMGTSTV